MADRGDQNPGLNYALGHIVRLRTQAEQARQLADQLTVDIGQAVEQARLLGASEDEVAFGLSVSLDL